MKLLYLDVSGSFVQSRENHDAIEALKSSMPDAQVFDFGTEVQPHPSRIGGAGTDFGCLRRHADNLGATEIHVVTDGYICVEYAGDPNRWTWHITPGGVKNHLPGKVVDLGAKS